MPSTETFSARVLLDGMRARPSRLFAVGHRFAYLKLEPALRHLLGR